jgi:hypothetical protein
MKTIFINIFYLYLRRKRITMNNLTKIIKLRGYSIAGFARQVLGLSYRTFKTQIDKETMRYKDIKIVLKELKIKFEDLETPEEKKKKKESK